MALKKLSPQGEWFVDTTGRKVILRGINLGGDTKVPFPNGGTQFPTDFSDHKEVSFIGRPFPLSEADTHFTRLKKWGFNVLRLLTTWEAVEHKGPGEYDEAYLDYFTEIVRLAGEYGFYVFVDFHQDVWSRMTGGDGAPGWIFEKMGIDYRKLSEADAAIVMQRAYDYNRPGIRQEENYPTMCWSQNYRYAGNAILWTLFFGGKDFAPNFLIDGKNVQDYLQGHYLGCMKQIAERVKDFDFVLGFDSLNEPGKGFIGRAMNDRGLTNTDKDPAKPGLGWSPIDALFSSHGHTIDLPYLTLKVWKGGFVPTKTVTVNKNQISIWLPESPGDPFQLEGAYTITKDGTPFIERNDFFQNVKGKAIDFDADYLIPFMRTVGETIRSIRNDWMVFIEREASDAFTHPHLNGEAPKLAVNAAHWYDILTLLFKTFLYPIAIDTLTKRPVFGKSGIEAMYVRQLTRIKNTADSVPGKIPSLIGEFGIPFDLQGGKAYKEWKKGNHSPKIWKRHVMALDAMYNAMDHLFLSNTLWNYTATNENDLMVGDGWNQEDLSIFSKDQIIPGSDPDVYGGGGRAIEGFCRPYAAFTQGTPIKMKYDLDSREFHFEWLSDLAITEPCVIKVPRFVYPNGVQIVLSNAEKISENEGELTVKGNGGKASLILTPL
ncbi:glycoside hydrolase family 5 protein [Leptospira terpstrae]|uniref:Cellulase (Glycosyl hydrolase family 5) domain protein n=1 Tax=Leptospira terpstrae serovar Hualin str. LT 11-33 = ATCC 700639 TaxID=1257025 RepID=N1VRT3_9LEPT|nr:cellulase family glycosylhydrolase [Leptospira terpstrae]EMY62429.1 cellulase (glycosyl hydrolase family 5) domain protein [Leptospira terpstrae serovar Hualin str. LT 11-33 = ATCC 700639]